MFNFPYSSTFLTNQINRWPNVYGYLNALGVFPSEGIPSRVVEIRFEDEQLVVLGSDEPGAPGQTTERETGNSFYIGVPHFPDLENILAKDLQGFLDVIGGSRVPKTFESEVARRLRQIKNRHAITREYIRLGALKGLIKDGRGRTLLNLFSTFGITQKAIDFDLGNTSSDIDGKCAQLVDWYGESMKGETHNGIEVFVAGDWFSAFVSHPKVQKYWLQSENAIKLAEIERARLGGQWGRVFDYQTIRFREYTGSMPVRTAQGVKTSEKIMASKSAIAYPTGTQNSFATYDGPTHHMAHVNEPGTEIFISTELLDHGEGVEFKSQSNCLAICKRPEFLVDVSTSTLPA